MNTEFQNLPNVVSPKEVQTYEYLIKKFADDSGHTAQEFYTNRTVVHLMTEMLKPESGESIYDPTCGSAGMLISAIAYLKAQNKEWRNVAVYGQEINALTSAIGRMNLFLHGVKDFCIVNGDTLKSPAFVENGKLKQFDLKRDELSRFIPSRLNIRHLAHPPVRLLIFSVDGEILRTYISFLCSNNFVFHLQILSPPLFPQQLLQSLLWC